MESAISETVRDSDIVTLDNLYRKGQVCCLIVLLPMTLNDL